ncbi:MAG: hypothetical protein R2720_08300 [Candidatus Nanopelagicales bacterium]
MSFEDLPDEWPAIPLQDPTHIADVLDLYVSMRARHEGALVVVVCDDQRRPVQPMQIDGVGRLPPPYAADHLARMAASLADAFPGATALFALARRGGLSVTAGDQAWRRCVEASFSEKLPVIGFHLVTPGGSRIVHTTGAAA